MAWRTSRIFKENLLAYQDDSVNIIVNKGGARSTKTFSILQLLYLIALHSKKPLTISVVTQTFPQLRQGAIRDFEKLTQELHLKTNLTTKTYYINNSFIEFFPAEQYQKVLGAQRDILFINECNRLNYEVVRQLLIRTSGKKFLDYNPVADFWINTEILPREDCKLITSTYLDNPFLSSSQIQEIEKNKHNANWWRVYGLGLDGKREGLVFPNFELVDTIPDGGKVRYGMDFGFNDPTTLIKVVVIEDSLYIDELVYRSGMVSADIIKALEANELQRRKDKIIADSAGVEQIQTLYRDGWNIHSAVKGANSITEGINRINKFKIKITKRSVNVEKEFLNYMWQKDRNEQLLDIPSDDFNHAIDAIRYALKDIENNTGTYNIR